MKEPESLCPLCNRPMPAGSYNEHHLIPASLKGKETVTLHIICHNAIHMNITTKELKSSYNTIELLLSNEKIKKFIKWVSNKPNGFYKTFRM